MASISSDDECYDALCSLGVGDAGPLIAYLEQETGILHPLVQRELAKLLLGTHPTHNLALKRNRGRPRSSKLKRAHRDREILASPSPEEYFENHGDAAMEVRRTRHSVKKRQQDFENVMAARVAAERSKK